MPTPSRSFPHALFEVSPDIVRRLDDRRLRDVMAGLLLAEAYKCGADRSRVIVNAEVDAPDEGQDAYTPCPAKESPWLGSMETCWQFKAGGASLPSRIAGEVTKPRPKRILAAGGRYVLVASDVGDGETGRDARLAVLRKDAEDAGLPSDRIDVLTGGEQLVTWINEHPAVAAALLDRDVLVPIPEWARASKHRDAFYPTEQLAASVLSAREALAFETPGPTHVHVFGPPGVGKTRFALEVCRDAPWMNSAVFIPQAARTDVRAYIDTARTNPALRAVVVVDEVGADDLRALAEAAERAEGRIRLMTIGQARPEDTTAMRSIRVEPLDADATTGLVRDLHPGMPIEHARFVASVSAGYVKLARLLAAAVHKDPSLTAVDLLKVHDVRKLMKQMLDGKDHRALLVVAVLETVGWTGSHEVEGRTIAEHFGLDWAHVQADVHAFDEDLGVAPRGGDFRYVSPAPLALFLAREAWASWPDRVRELPGKLPPGAVDKFYARFRALSASGDAAVFAREELDRFLSVADFATAFDVRRWEAVSAADPERAVRRLREALERASREERLAVDGNARREMVWSLVRAARSASTFEDAALALAELAAAETETWANNATHEFVARFVPAWGGTAKPYTDRLSVLDRLFARGSHVYQALAVQALARVGDRYGLRLDAGSTGARAEEPEWIPSGHEELDAALSAMDRLARVAATAAGDVRAELIAAVKSCAWFLVVAPTQAAFSRFVVAVAATLPDERDRIDTILEDVVDRELKYGHHEASSALLETARKTIARVQDTSREGQLRRLARKIDWERKGISDEFRELARELLTDPSPLWNTWSWLTSGTAPGAWSLGEALGMEDTGGRLLQAMVDASDRGPDARVIAAYLEARSRTVGQEAVEEWIDKREAAAPGDVALLLELAWRVSRGDRAAARVVRMLERGSVPPERTATLGYGSWVKELSPDAARNLIAALAARDEHREAALVLLDDWVDVDAARIVEVESLATEFVCDGKLIRAGGMTSYHWSRTAKRILERHARNIARAIFAEQAEGAGMWFADHSDAGEILDLCTKADPAGVWDELAQALENPPRAVVFVIGMPKGLVDQMPQDAVIAWISKNVPLRASLVAKLAKKDLDDDGLSARVLQEFADDERVRSAFTAEYWSGAWSGPMSVRLGELASQLDQVAGRTRHPRVRDWAVEAAAGIRDWARAERKREDEYAIGR